MLLEQTPHDELGPSEEEPDDLRPVATQAHSEWSDLPSPRPTAEEYLTRGERAYARAKALKALHGLTPDTTAEYRKAASYFIGTRALEPASHETAGGEHTDPVRLIMLADCQAEQSQADVVAPYKGDDYAAGGKWESIDRRTELRKAAYANLRYASALILGADEHDSLLEAFRVEDPTKALAAAAVEAALSLDTAEHAITTAVIDEDTAELLENEGTDGVLELIDKQAGQLGAASSRFVSEAAENFLEDATDLPNAFSLAA